MDFTHSPLHRGYQYVLVITVCFLDGLKPFPDTRLTPLVAKKMLETRFPTWSTPSIIPRDWGSRFTGQIIQVLMKALHWPLSLSPSYQARFTELTGPSNLKSLMWMKLPTPLAYDVVSGLAEYWQVRPSGNKNSLYMRQSPVDPCSSVNNFPLIPCYSLSVSTATQNLECVMLKPILNRLEKPSQIPTQRILLVTVWCLVTGYPRNGIKGKQPSSPVEQTPPSAPGGWHCCKTRRHWNMGPSHS